MKKFCFQEVVAIYESQKPTVYWEIGEEQWANLRTMKDARGQYIVVEDGDGESAGPPATLLGHPFKIVAGDDLILVTIERGAGL